MKYLTTKIFGFVCLLTMTLCLSSCSASYVHLSYDAHHGAVRNAENGNEIAFIASTSAYRPATGIARFPDGGQPEYLFQKVSLYLLDAKTHHITELIDFSDLVALIGASKTNWKSKLIYQEPFVFYHVSPITSWALHAKWKKNSISSEQAQQLQNNEGKNV